MKVLLRRNVSKLGKIGEVVEVKASYARNYLLPQRVAVQPTQGNLKAIEAEKKAYLEQLAKERAELETQAQAIEGKEITIAVRSNPEGHLYGSVGAAQISAVLAKDGVFVEADYIVLDNPIRTLDKYEVAVRFSEEVSATISVWVVPLHEEGDEVPDGEAAAEDHAETEPTPDEETPPDPEQ